MKPTPFSEFLMGKANLQKKAYKHGFGVLAPLYTDNDCLTGATYYREYKSDTMSQNATETARVNAVLDRVKRAVHKYSGELINPNWVLVVTWENMLPRLNYDATKDKVGKRIALFMVGYYFYDYFYYLYKMITTTPAIQLLMTLIAVNNTIVTIIDNNNNCNTITNDTHRRQ